MEEENDGQNGQERGEREDNFYEKQEHTIKMMNKVKHSLAQRRRRCNSFSWSNVLMVSPKRGDEYDW